jgi:hypothetical protein
MAGFEMPGMPQRDMRAESAALSLRGCSEELFLARGYSETRVDIPESKPAKWLFPQEKATWKDSNEGTFTLVSL